MSKKNINNRNDLLDSFKAVSKDFDTIKDNIKSRELLINDLITKLTIASNKDPLLNSGLPKDHPLRKMTEDSLSIVKSQINEWDKSIRKYECNIQFREKFGDSLLVFVYGKVKAGKSSLGNYIAYGTSKPTSEIIDSATPKPKFFFEKSTGKNEAMTEERMSEVQSFGVGSTETTSSIQGFTLSGLTWIDSPGIHSMNEINGELAKDYANSADIIVFLSTSSSPARQSELKEIIELLNQKNPLIILITFSDSYEHKRDNEGKLIKPFTTCLQMKTKKDQTDQINYFEEELKKLTQEHPDRLLDMRVYPISTAYVEIEDNVESSRWQESGMGNFSQRLAEITTSKGMALKKSTPLNNLSSFFNGISSDINIYQKEITKISDKLKDEREQIAKDSEHILTSMQSDLSSQIEKFADRYAMNNKDFSKACYKALDESLQQNTERLFQKLGQRMDNIKGFACLPEGSLILPEFRQKTENVRYQSTVNSKRGGALGAGLLGLGATIAAAALTGGASLLVTAGVAAVSGVAAGVAGDKLGRLAGEQFDGNESMTVNVGDNRQEVSIATRKKLIELASLQLQQLIIELDTICFQGTANWLENISASLDNLHQSLNKQQNEIIAELSAINKG